MKQIHKMTDTELKQFCLSLEGLAITSSHVSEVLSELRDNDKHHVALANLSEDVAKLTHIVFWWKTHKGKPYTREDIESFARHMLKLCKNITLNLSHQFNEFFGFTELDIHEVVNGFVEDCDLNEKQQS